MNPLVLVPIFAFLFVAVLIFAIYRFATERRELVRERLEQYAAGEEVPFVTSEVATLLKERKFSESPTLDAVLKKGTWAQKTALDLARADVNLRVGEFLLIRLGTALGFGIIVFAFSLNPIAAVIVGVIGYFVPRLYLARAYQGRVNKLTFQLVDALALMANSIKAGYGFLQAMEDVAREMPPPISTEFNEVIREVQLGADVEIALNNMVARIRSYDLDLVVTAILIQRRVGGNLVEILDNIAYTIRERIKLLGEVRALTAEVRLSGWILAGLPFFVFLVLYIIQPGYITPLVTTFGGRIMAGMAIVSMIIGIYFMRRLATIEI